MTYERLDKQCRAKVIAVTDDRVLVCATWNAAKQDIRNFKVANGIAHNIVYLPKSYFEQKYGVAL
jgi:hypothetical protein